MRHYKEVKIPAKPATTKKRLEKVTCDICKSEINNCGYSTDKVDIHRAKGEVFPECGNTTHTIFDCCGKCFEAHIIPLFESFGAEPKIEKDSW